MNPQKDTRSIIVYIGTTASRDFSLESAERGYKIVPHTTLWHTAKRKNVACSHLRPTASEHAALPGLGGWEKFFESRAQSLRTKTLQWKPHVTRHVCGTVKARMENMEPKSAVFLLSTEKTKEHTNRKAKSCKHEWKLTICG